MAAEEGERRGATTCSEDSGGKWRAQVDVVQLEKEKDEFNKKMEEKEQIDLKEKSNFSCFSWCIVVFVLLGLLFVLKYSSL